MKGKRFTVLVLSGLLLAGCAGGAGSSSSAPSSAPPAASSAPPAPSSPRVQVDWSRLEQTRSVPQADVDGGRWFPEYADRLVPGEDYGPLIPYLGGQAYSFQQWEADGVPQVYWNDWPTSFYGLMTREGKIVVDPVYQSVIPYNYRWRGDYLPLPVLLLAQAAPQWEDFGGSRYAVAAEDGSWVTGFEFLSYTNWENKLLLLRPEGYTLLDSHTGARRDWSWAELGLGENMEDSINFVRWFAGLNWTIHGAGVGCSDMDPVEELSVRVLDPDTGEASWVEFAQWEEWCRESSDLGWGEPEDMIHRDGGLAFTVKGQSYFLPRTARDCYLYMLQGDFAVLDEQQAGKRFFSLYRLSTGEMLMEAQMFLLLQDRYDPGRVLPDAQVDGLWTVYSQDLEPLFSLPPVPEEEWIECSLWGSLLSFQCSDFFGCYDLDGKRYVFYRNLGLGD